MRQRLSSSLFMERLGSDFTEDFYEGITYGSKVERESVIETVYNNNTLLTTTGHVDIMKKGWSDGFMRFRYTDKIVRFYGLQETKRDVNPTNTQITKQLIQVFGYYNQLSELERQQCLVLCINSAYFYGYVFIKDIQELLDEVLDALKTSGYSASRLYKNCPEEAYKISRWLVDNWYKMHIQKLSTDAEAKKFELHKIFREIYLNCL